MPIGVPAGKRRRTFWERSLPGWHIACYALLAMCVFALLVEDNGLPQRTAGVALAVAFAATYTFLGRHLLGKDDEARGSIYLLIAISIVSALLYLSPAGSLLLFVLIPQIWAIVTTRRAMAMTALFAFGMTVAISARGGWTQEATRDALITGGLNLAMGLVLGLWISGLIRESDQRAHLIEELQATRAQLAEAHHQQGVLAERTRLASAIHDTLAQGFTSLLMLVQAAEAALETNDVPLARDRLKLADYTSRENLAESRALVAELGPLELQTATLPDAIHRLAERIGAELGLQADVTIDGAPRPLQANTEVVLLRATQEALSNIRKHAGAHAVHVRLAYDDEATMLEVADDGRGFEPARVDGFGLRGMRTRVEQVGGQLEVASSSGRGTTVRVRVP